ncbi:MAG TPA: formyl transferase [Sphingomicrobium sp.]|nr:formyl transferase [Sphingomicrobium sp.]
MLVHRKSDRRPIVGSRSLWKSAILRLPAASVVQDSLFLESPVWLPSPETLGFRADPFGLWHAGRLHVFVERLDLADVLGRIEVLTYSEELELLSIDLALNERWHLSYPYVFASGDDHWMLPEARGAGRLTLYRASSFPLGWRPELTIPLPAGAVDATPVFWREKWWLFYCLRQGRSHRKDRLQIAFADKLSGPWQQHPLNPVRTGLSGCRPGGSPLIGDGYIDLPVQDASNGYGGALRRLRIRTLDETQFEAEDFPWLHAPPTFAPFNDGLHTLSSAGDVSLIDVKRIDRSVVARLFNARARKG